MQRIAPEAGHSTVCLNTAEVYKHGQAKNQVLAATTTKRSSSGFWDFFFFKKNKRGI